MKKFLTMAILVVAMISGNAQAGELVQGYVTNSYGEVWKNSFGECWRDEHVATNELKVECGYPAPVVCSDNIVVSNLNFAFDSFAITDAGYNTLITAKDLINRTVLEGCPSINFIEITGHTDSIGTDAYNLALSIKRANAVITFLNDIGVKSQMVATGMGETNPIAGNETDNGRALNRRVVIEVK